MKPEIKVTYQSQPAISTCGFFDNIDFYRMAAGAMNDDEMGCFVRHCEECDECSRALWDFQKVKIAGQEDELSATSVREDNPKYGYSVIKEQDEKLLRRSLDFLDKLRNS